MDAALALACEKGGLRTVPVDVARWHFGEALLVPCDPTRITHWLPDNMAAGRAELPLRTSFVAGRDWSKRAKPMEENATFETMRQLVEARSRFRQTGSYAELLASAEAGTPRRANGIELRDRAAVDAYFESRLALVRAIEENGFVARARVSRAVRWGDGRNEHGERDVNVAIDRDERVFRFMAGRHRFAIARALGIRSIPVDIRAVDVRLLRRLARGSGLPIGPAFRAWLVQIGANDLQARPD